MEIEDLWDRCAGIATEARLPERSIGPLCDGARGRRLRNWSYRQAVEESDGTALTEQAATRDLKALVKAGLLEAEGETRGRYYVGSRRLQDQWLAIVQDRRNWSRADLFSETGEQLRLGLAR
jgi:DNA-binding transcriptional ArsR family regulator